MSDSWEDETASTSPSSSPSPYRIFPKPQSSQMSAAVLQGLANHHSTTPTPVSGIEDDGITPAVNQLNAAMNAQLQRGGEVKKLKILRRTPANSSLNSANSTNLMQSETTTTKTAEQREREYEEMRAAIFSGQLDGLANSNSGLSEPTNGSAAGIVRIVQRGSGPSPTTVSASSPDSDDPNNPAIQPSAAALAEVQHHHSKRHEKHAALQNKHRQRSGQAKNHRIIEDLVSNRATPPATRPEIHDPDFNRNARHLYQPPAYGGYPSQPLIPSPYSHQSNQQPLLTMNVPGVSHFAAGPHGNMIGFGRGRNIPDNNNSSHSYPSSATFAHASNSSTHQSVSSSTSTPTTSAYKFNPTAQSFVPQSSYVYTPSQSHNTPNVYMGTNQPRVSPNDNYYVAIEQQRFANAAYSNPVNPPTNRSGSPPPFSTSTSSSSHSNPPPISDEAAFPSLNRASVAPQQLSGQWKAKN